MGKIVLWLCLLVLTACSSGNCRRLQSKNPNAKAAEIPKEHVFVYKYDGSQQCQTGKPIAVKQMEKELTSQQVKVFSGKNQHDGLMHIQVCGSPTGQINIYEILEKDLGKAENLGFKKWSQTQ